MSSVAAAQSEATSLKADYKMAKNPLLERFKTAANVDAPMRALAHITDDALRSAWSACELSSSFALVAVVAFVVAGASKRRAAPSTPMTT